MELNKTIPVCLDGDPGHDDAIAWTLANAIPGFRILSVTSGGGNQTLAKTTYNMRRICALTGIKAPYAKGADKPLFSELVTAGNFHGESGLDGPALPEPDRELSELSAVELMHQVIMESEDPVTIISTGPQTNVASLLLTYPEVKKNLAKISIMGGGIFSGNWTPAAEFNILEDPEAAKIVFESGIPVQMCGLDVTEKALMMPADAERIGTIGNPVSEIVAGWLRFFFKHHEELGFSGSPLHDPCAVISLVRPDLFKIQPMYVQIETKGRYTRGTTVGDAYGLCGKAANADVVLDVDREGFVDFIVETLRHYDGMEDWR